MAHRWREMGALRSPLLEEAASLNVSSLKKKCSICNNATHTPPATSIASPSHLYWPAASRQHIVSMPNKRRRA